MADPMVALGVLVAGYVLGTVPTAIVVGRQCGHDPTAEGSGNPGASNVLRTTGRRAAALVLAGDLLKGAVGAGIGLALGDRVLALAAGLAAVIGHVAPVTRLARGGKGVATVAGLLAVTFPVAAGLAAATWIVVVRITHTASAASLAALGVVLVAVAAQRPPASELVLVGLAAAVVAARHAGNIARLTRGDERRLRAERP